MLINLLASLPQLIFYSHHFLLSQASVCWWSDIVLIPRATVCRTCLKCAIHLKLCSNRVIDSQNIMNRLHSLVNTWSSQNCFLLIYTTPMTNGRLLFLLTLYRDLFACRHPCGQTCRSNRPRIGPHRNRPTSLPTSPLTSLLTPLAHPAVAYLTSYLAVN